MKNKIFIDKKYLDYKDLHILLAIIYLSKRYWDDDTLYFTIPSINKVLYNSFEITKKRKADIKKAIEYFEEEQIIKIIKVENEYYEIENNFKVNTKDATFIITSLDELKTLAELKIGKKDTLINYYLKLLSTINNKTKVGYWTIEDLAEDVNISTRTVKDYNEILEDAELIYIKRFNNTKVVNGKAQRLNNIYGRFADKDAVEEYSKDRILNLERIEASDKLDANESKSISKQYNDYVNGTYTGDVSSLYDKCKLYNKAKPDKEKDLSVFDINSEPTYKYINNDERFGNPFN